MIENYLVKARQEELFAEAERRRLLSVFNKNSAQEISKVSRFFIWFGGSLSRWGSRIEQRFEVEVKPNRTHQVDRGLKV